MRAILVASIAVAAVLCCGCPVAERTLFPNAATLAACSYRAGAAELQGDLAFYEGRRVDIFFDTTPDTYNEAVRTANNICSSLGDPCQSCELALVNQVYGR